MAIILHDKAMATEIFVEVFLQIYKLTDEMRDQETLEKFGEGLHKVLESSTKFDYSCITCIQRIAQQLLKNYNFSMDSNVI
jgi:hypothetical protein